MTIEEFFADNKIDVAPESGGKEVRIICPWCKHPKQKCYVNTTGGMFYCFHCGIGGGFTQLAEQLKVVAVGIDLDERYEPEKDEYPLTPIDPDLIAESHQRLLETDRLMLYLQKARGLTPDTIAKFKLGFDGRNLIIPIFTANGDCLNFKLRPDPTRPSGSGAKEFSIPGRGKVQLFNEKVLQKKKQERVIVCEGLFDCMLLTQKGYDAVTSTGGCSNFKPEWVEHFARAEKVYICFDNDKNNAGQKAATKVGQTFYEKNNTKVWTITLPPLLLSEEKLDVSDFFLKRKKEKSEFTLLLFLAQQFLSNLHHGEYNFIESKDLMDMEFPPDQFIVEHFIPEKSIICLAGAPGDSKSYFTNYLAQCIITEQLLLGKYSVKKVPILFIDKENNLPRIQDRLEKLGLPKGVNNDLHFFAGDFLFTKPDALSTVENFIVTHGIKLVVLDSLVRMHTQEEDKASDMNKVYQGLYRLKEAGASVLFIHHFKKYSGQSKIDVRDLLRGSGDILAQVDTYFAFHSVIRVKEEEGPNLMYVNCEFGKTRDEAFPKPFVMEVSFYPTETHFEFLKEVAVTDPAQIQLGGNEQKIYQYIKEYTPTRKDILEHFKDTLSSATIDRVLRKLKEVERITSMTNGSTDQHYAAVL